MACTCKTWLVFITGGRQISVTAEVCIVKPEALMFFDRTTLNRPENLQLVQAFAKGEWLHVREED